MRVMFLLSKKCARRRKTAGATSWIVQFLIKRDISFCHHGVLSQIPSRDRG
jgi:hypothetical protein